MKRFFVFLFACFALSASAASRVTVTLTITNNPVGHDTFVVNAKTITWTNATSGGPSTLVLLGANIGASQTNLFRQLASYPLSGPVDIARSSSNIITIKGAIDQAMSASMAGTWGTISYSTQTISQMNVIRVPMSGEEAVPQTNNPTKLAQDLGTYSQAAFAAGTTLVENMVQTTGAQTVAGVKTFSNDVVVEGNLVLTNNGPTARFYDMDGATDEKVTFIAVGEFGMSFDFYKDDLSDVQTAFYIARDGMTPTSVEFISPVSTAGLTVAGTNHFTRLNHTTLAAGNNAGVDFGNTTFVKIKPGPAGVFAICGIDGGYNGRELRLYNATGQAMTIANDSGVEPVPANRIYTNTGSDRATTGNGFVVLLYDSEDSRWVVQSFDP
jgi:hypothetical protein